MKLKGLFLTLILGFILAGCSSDSPEATPPIQDDTRDAVAEEATPFKAINFTASQKAIAQSSQDISTRLLQTIASEDGGNILISPFGIHAMLSMIANGTEGDSLSEILKTLGTDKIQDLNEYYAKVTSALAEADGQVTLANVNALWAQPFFTLSEGYAQTIKDSFNANVFSAPLHTNESRLQINQWIYDRTDGKITESLKGNIKENIGMLLLNALSFSGKWAYHVAMIDAGEENFYGQDRTSEVAMMKTNNASFISHVPENGVKVSLPFGNLTFTLNIFLPDEGISLEEFIAAGSLTKTVETIDVPRVTLPKFNLIGEELNLKDHLNKLGLIKIFDNTTSLPKNSEDLYTSSFIQKTAIEINEKTAQVQSYSTEEGGEMTHCEKHKFIKVNRPFIFTITAYHDIVLFAGIVRNL